VPHLDLPERRQDCSDVLQERLVRPDDQHTRVGDVPAADVAGRVGAGCVDPPEEQRAARIVDEGASTLPQGVGKVLAGDPVTGRRLQGQGVLAHPGELVAGVLEIGLLAGELQGRVSGHEEATSDRPGEGEGNPSRSELAWTG
jgi:hypothetical protein